MIKFQKNKTQLFECKIKIEGADKSNAKPRLILYPNKDSRNIFFEGTIVGDSCKIHILPNLNISETGKAVLEVIVENSILFQPWSTEYEIITEKVQVDEIQLSNSKIGATVRVLEDDIKINDKKLIESSSKPKVINKKPIVKTPKKPVSKKIEFNSLLDEAASMITDSQAEDKNKLKIYTESIKSLGKTDIKKMVEYINKDFVPLKESILWSKRVLGEASSIKARMLMYCYQIAK